MMKSWLKGTGYANSARSECEFVQVQHIEMLFRVPQKADHGERDYIWRAQVGSQMVTLDATDADIEAIVSRHA
jgi:hypothetical protein